ncbi:hypothetical protein PHSY_002967 [Pseudozyma hubeiensis SY62]|uniref:Uncharacterized protein n=1 Tax=Pseudozyma hubeiensis (strain SY62) TaxID=1305764 RepID=R9P2G9_PSEHS|nr:hypothetical protein PHSY_002967 [Pseudozyma hubeiensis SY62]GAC95392.1 hypothetical protein PHSY_002967 [Pseudozyma hubeiensis SY62]
MPRPSFSKGTAAARRSRAVRCGVVGVGMHTINLDSVRLCIVVLPLGLPSPTPSPSPYPYPLYHYLLQKYIAYSILIDSTLTLSRHLLALQLCICSDSFGSRLPDSCTNIDTFAALFGRDPLKATIKLSIIVTLRHLPPNTHSACISSSERV